MAKLELTKQEKAAISWLDLDDDALGKLVRRTCLELPKLMAKGETEMGKIWVTSCAILMCNMAADANATEANFDLKGITLADKERGDWQITIKRIQAPNAGDQRPATQKL
jgi:hypothetical protein